MKLSFTKIFFITIGLSLAFVLFAGNANAAGCCQLYYKLGSACDKHLSFQNKIKNLSGVSTFQPTCLINNYKKIDAGDTGNTLKDKSIGLVKDAYNLLVGTAQWSAELATDYEEWFGKTTWMIETEDFHCIDGYLDECRTEADSQGVIAFWSTKACDPEACEDYSMTMVLPANKIVSPLCWPKNECSAVCKSGECWSGPSSDCEDGRGFCFTDPTDVELAIDIGGVGRVRDIGSYIALMYNYLIGVLIIVAIVMIMYGGFRWITAAGSPERIGDAKRTIVSAVIGLLLGLFSYTILNIINPNILKLELPPIKRVRAIYFEVQPVRCQDYTSKFDCDQNKKNFNTDGDNKGCKWIQFAGFGSQCTTAKVEEGNPGNVCAEGNKCSSGWCLGYNVRYLLGPHASEHESATRWCTDGTMDMPCRYDTDCKDGFKCDKNLSACVGINSGRPVMANCEKDGHCASGFCNSGQCRSGNAGTNCIDGKCAESQGFKCVKFGSGDKCCPPAAAEKGGDGCYINCETDDQCADGQYCWERDARVETESGDMDSRRIGALTGMCFKKSSSGGRCFNDSGCKSGLICLSLTAHQPDDPVVMDLVTTQDGFPIPLPIETDSDGKEVQYTKIQVGTCQAP